MERKDEERRKKQAPSQKPRGAAPEARGDEGDPLKRNGGATRSGDATAKAKGRTDEAGEGKRKKAEGKRKERKREG